MALDDILLEAEEKMMKTEQVVINEFAGVRTGRASAGLVENIVAEVYGSQMRIRELANINTPEPRTLVIQPWDITSLQPIEKAIQKANIAMRKGLFKQALEVLTESDVTQIGNDGAMMVVQFFVVLFFYPETKGLSLEELQKKLGIA